MVTAHLILVPAAGERGAQIRKTYFAAAQSEMERGAATLSLSWKTLASARLLTESDRDTDGYEAPLKKLVVNLRKFVSAKLSRFDNALRQGVTPGKIAPV